MKIPDTLRKQLEKATAIIERIFEEDLLAIHLYGSAVEGGLKPYSDIDLLVTTRVPLTTAQREALMQELLSVSAWPGTSTLWRALEVTVVVHTDVVPWRFPPRREMQFGEWLREDILAGKYEPAQQDSDLAILLTQVRSASMALTGERADLLFEPVPENDIRKTFRQTLTLWQDNGDLQGRAQYRVDPGAHLVQRGDRWLYRERQRGRLVNALSPGRARFSTCSRAARLSGTGKR